MTRHLPVARRIRSRRRAAICREMALMERFEQRAERVMTRSEVAEGAAVWRAAEAQRIAQQYRGPYGMVVPFEPGTLTAGMIVANSITINHAPLAAPLYRVTSHPYGLGDPVIDWDAS